MHVAIIKYWVSLVNLFCVHLICSLGKEPGESGRTPFFTLLSGKENKAPTNGRAAWPIMWAGGEEVKYRATKSNQRRAL